jgi:hypothetical protein
MFAYLFGGQANLLAEIVHPPAIPLYHVNVCPDVFHPPAACR